VAGPVIRGFEPPLGPYGAGHRGIDIAAPFGTPFRAPAPGVISFAGTVAGHRFVSIDHGGGVVSSYSWVSQILVRKGDAVGRGTVVGLTGFGHPGADPPHVHIGVRVDGVYVDPLSFLGPPDLVSLIHLAPIGAVAA
jgi:murein DD-endopeptidase MepM/ murein hydrolase activator NlpD